MRAKSVGKIICRLLRRTVTMAADSYEIRTYTCTTNGSYKFWTIEIDYVRRVYLTCWGRIGGTAQISKPSITYYSTSGLEAAVNKLTNSKTMKGYVLEDMHKQNNHIQRSVPVDKSEQQSVSEDEVYNLWD